jgi:hypothetical protein
MFSRLSLFFLDMLELLMHNRTMNKLSNEKRTQIVAALYVERQNLTMRMQIRRFTRLTNGFSKKVENHAYHAALHYMHYNFCRIHKTLRVTPTMEDGITDQVWTIEEMLAKVLS